MLGPLNAMHIHLRTLKQRGRSKQLARRFHKDERGNLIVLAGILLPVILGAVSAGVFYSKINAGRSKMQAALDAAVLAGVIASYDVNKAQGSFQSNVTSTLISAVTASFTVDGAILSGTASGTVANPLGGLFGIPETL